MTKMIPIVITILICRERYLFIQRRNPPYEGLWSMVGGKVNIGEHVHAAARREIVEETGSSEVFDYDLRGIVSERLVDSHNNLLSQFLIFVGHASINDFQQNHREGELALFSLDEIEKNKMKFLPSDYEMFQHFLAGRDASIIHEAELLRDEKGYHLLYYRVP